MRPLNLQVVGSYFGQLPDDTDQLAFKTLQTYSDGDVVRWIEEAAAGDDEPENPAPVLKLTAKESEDGDETPAASTTAAATSTKSTTASSSSSDSTARGLGIAGLIVGVLGLAAGAFAIVRSRTPRS